MKKDNLILERLKLPNTKKIFLTMKLMLLITTVNLVSCWASVYSQKVTLDLHDVKFVEVIEEISRQTNLDFAYSKEIVDLERPISIKVINNDLKFVMDNLLEGTQLLHLELNGKIYIGPKSWFSPL